MAIETDTDPHGGTTYVSNPAPATLGPAEERKLMDNKQNTKPPAKKNRQPNPLSGMGPMINHILAVGPGAAAGVLDAVSPSWWAMLTDGGRALLFLAAGIGAGRMKNAQLVGACECMAAFYAGRLAAVYALKMKAGKTDGAGAKGGLKGLLADLQDNAAGEMEEARRAFLDQLEANQRGDNVAGFISEDDVAAALEQLNGLVADRLDGLNDEATNREAVYAS